MHFCAHKRLIHLHPPPRSVRHNDTPVRSPRRSRWAISGRPRRKSCRARTRWSASPRFARARSPPSRFETAPSDLVVLTFHGTRSPSLSPSHVPPHPHATLPSSQLTDNLLKKPPFRFLHDVVSEVIRNTGYARGLFDDRESDSANIKDKETKVAWLNKIIACVSLSLDEHLPARPLKIVAGLEPSARTNFYRRSDAPRDAATAPPRCDASSPAKRPRNPRRPTPNPPRPRTPNPPRHHRHPRHPRNRSPRHHLPRHPPSRQRSNHSRLHPRRRI